ncbi:MAG: peptide chain release factor N(5)-glutamine methyltransferase [Clostridia bacterium]|nr:peptide chain release factor N(5)-glutamine methyltransferase [Clostridia bacterium]
MSRGFTLREAYEQGRTTLSLAGLESPAFDALCLFEMAFGIGDRASLAIHGGEPAEEGRLEQFNRLIIRRTREPLQYILGRWEFDGMELSVGEGVLVPREDTMALVETACSRLADNPSPHVLDLCAGSGAVGLAIAKNMPSASVVCVEKSTAALPYLRQNIEEYGQGRVKCVEGDVLQAPSGCGIHGSFDCVVSNPPYIPSGDIEGLAWEVRCEPRMALDGGKDGLVFYRAICDLWMPLVRNNGLVAFEIGYDIRDGVMEIMSKHNIHHIQAAKDFGGIDRCIFGTVVS